MVDITELDELAGTSSLADAVDAVIRRAKASMPDEESKQQIEAGLMKFYHNPPVEGMEIVLKKNLTKEEAQHLLFSPDLQAMQLYPMLLASGMDADLLPADHPLKKVVVPFMALLYLHHVYEWKQVKEFIVYGGLHALAQLFVHSSAYLRSQAVHCFYMITQGTDDFDWFEPVRSDQKRLHEELLSLSSSDFFIKNLLSNYSGYSGPYTVEQSRAVAGRFPGGPFYALRIFAFYCSWVRALYCQDQVLRLGTSILLLLKRWSEDQDGTEEERQLSKQLYEDFSRWPPADDAVHPASAQQTFQFDAEQAAATTTAATTTATASEPQPQSQLPQKSAKEMAESYKLEGNQHFCRKEFHQAVECYTKSIDKDPDCAIYYSNRSLAYERCGDVDNALADVNRALALDSKHIKSLGRKARILNSLGRYSEAMDAANRAYILDPSSAEISSLMDTIQACLKQATRTTKANSTSAATATVTATATTTTATATTTTSSTTGTASATTSTSNTATKPIGDSYQPNMNLGVSEVEALSHLLQSSQRAQQERQATASATHPSQPAASKQQAAKAEEQDDDLIQRALNTDSRKPKPLIEEL